MRDLLDTVRERELAQVGAKLQAETGLTYRPGVEGQRISGKYARSLVLASGRFALLDDGVGFSLVPWRPVIERRLGQSIAAVVRGSDVSWLPGRQRGPSIAM